MAYIAQSDKLKVNGAADEETPAAAQTSSGPLDVSGTASSVVGQGTGGTAGGTQGAWTNIQAYMNANAGDTGSAKALDDKVKTQFDTEKNNIQTDSTKLKTEAQGVAAGVSEAQKNAALWTEQAGKDYNYAGTTQSDVYNTNKTQLQNALNSEYKGPTSYNYGFTNDTQAAGAALNNTDGFKQYMNDIYNKQAGGALSSGGRALQSQLDVNNESLDQTRQKLAGDYTNLGAFRDQAVTDTTAALSDAEKAYRTNQNQLRDYLTNQSGTLDSNIAKQESDAKYEYDQNFRTGLSGRNGFDIGMNTSPYAGSYSPLRDMAYKDNYTWSDLDRWSEQGAANVARGGSDWEQVRPNDLQYWTDFRANAKENRNVLNNFYTAQDSKYANVADADEKQWNFIQDVLGSADRKEQGFKVRGK